VTIRWEDLDARARGLATHLLGRAELQALAQSPDRAALADGLRQRGYPVEEGEPTAEALELALRRAAAQRLRVLARWSGARADALTVLFEDEDRRSLRALLRGAVQGATAATRLAGLIATPTLPERALRELAARDKPAAIAALLVAWRNPYGSALLPAAAATQPDLFQLELLVNRTFAARALRAAGHRGPLAAYVRETLDLENAFSALALAGEAKDVTPKDAFLPGGERLTIAAFEIAAAGQDWTEAMRRLARSFVGTALARVFDARAGDPAQLETTALRARVREQVHAMRLMPLGPAPVLAYALRLRAEMEDLRRIIWGVALAAPRAGLVAQLVTA
jgi:vacuolar-type H+-ATPase subunit C/Vma6